MRSVFINPEEGRLRAGWRIALCGLLSLVFMLVIIAPFALLNYAIDRHHNWFGKSGFSLLTMAISGIATVLAVWIAGRYLDRRPMRDFGLRLDRQWAADYGAGFAVGGLLMVLVFAILRATHSLTVTSVTFNAAVLQALLTALLLHVFVGVQEELSTRGYQLLNLEEGLRFGEAGRRMATMLAVALTSVGFGLAHAMNANADTLSITNIVFTGIALAVPLLLTRQLGFSMGVHTAWNFFQGAVLGFAVSGYAPDNSVVRSSISGPRWLTGGAFGPEGGVLDLVASALLIVLAIAWVRWTRGSVSVLPPAERRVAVPVAVAVAGPFVDDSQTSHGDDTPEVAPPFA